MSKFIWILLGLVLVGGAVALGGYRNFYEPNQRTRSVASAPSASRSAPPVSTQRAPQSASQGASLNFDTVVNVLNVVVGIVGIWMTFAGMRMQRQAMQMTDNRRQR